MKPKQPIGMMIGMLLLCLGLSLPSHAQTISFLKTNLGNESSTNPTSLQFGPDGRLYVAQQNGTIYVYTIQRTGPANPQKDSDISYQVVATEVINVVKNQTPNHNDDGSANGTKIRQVTGILVVGTAQNPIIYVSSSDWRIAINNDSNLDTNSGVVSRLTKNGNSWDKVDLIRGLPRCEENHSTNGMVLDETNNILYVTSGGHTNKGAPSKKLAAIPEYALSAALLSVDLNMINAMPVYTDSRTGTKFVYDIPTLDDPTRNNITNSSPNFPYPSNHPLYNSSIDLGDPFGGNDGMNQAMMVKNGPIEIYSPGYRNIYDIVITESGRMYTYDNGPNSTWGGTPLTVSQNGQVYATNELNENNSDSQGDGLHYITGKGYYGGHPNPTRANPAQSLLYLYDKINGVWTQTGLYDFNNPNHFPEPPVPLDMANPVEADYLTPGVPRNQGGDGALATVNNFSVNGMDEYVSNSFNGAMKGDLLAASYLNGVVYRYKLNADGTQVIEEAEEFTGFGYEPLDLTTQGDNDIFPGTVWVCNYGDGTITVFEPKNDVVNCDTSNPNADSDGDFYTNQDEVDNGTNPCSAGSKPEDTDGTFINGFLISDYNDPDDDDDGVLDVNDPFSRDANNGLTTNLPINYPFTNNNPGTGFFGLGFTGLMSNGSTNYLDFFDSANLDAGGASGKFTIDNVTEGDPFAKNNINNQDYGFLFGINVDQNSNPFTVHSRLEPPYFSVSGSSATPVNYQSWGIFIGTGDQDNYVKIVFNANNGQGGIQIFKEADGSDSETILGPTFGGVNILNASQVDVYLSVNPAALNVQPKVSLDGGLTILPVGPAVSIPASWLSSSDNKGLAVGVISTSIGQNALPFTATWDFINVTEDEPDNSTNSEAKAFFEAKPPYGGLIGASTWTPKSFTITNESASNSGIKITQVSLDMSTSVLPNVAFDPFGTAGDKVGKGFDPNQNSAGVGLGTHSLEKPIGNGGFQKIVINFNDFDPQETFKFSIDADPISTEGFETSGADDQGSISGLEMVGGIVQVTFSDGTTFTNELYSDNSNEGAYARLRKNLLGAPSIKASNLNSPTTANSASQVIEVTGGVPNGTVSLLKLEAAKHIDNSEASQSNYTFGTYEVNSVIKKNRSLNIQLNGNGAANIPVTLTDSKADGAYNIFVVAPEDGNDFGLTSNQVLIEYDVNSNPPSGDDPVVTSFSLINASTDQIIGTINNNDVINLADYPGNTLFSIVANANGEEESVTIQLSGAKNVTKTESVAPYALFGDSNNNFEGQTFGIGSYTVTGTAFSGNGGQGIAGTPLVVNFSFVNNSNPTQYTLNLQTDGNGTAIANPANGPYNGGTSITLTATPNNGYEFTAWTNELGSVVSAQPVYSFSIFSDVNLTANFSPVQSGGSAITSFSLVNATTNQVIGFLNNNDQINLADYPENTVFSIIANADGSEESVKLELSGAKTAFKVESVAPYALYGDSNGNYTGQTFGLGSYTIKGTPYSDNGASGVEGIPVSVNFSFVNNSGGTQYNLTLLNDGNGSAEVNQQGPYAPGTFVTVTATPNAGYEFVNWTFGNGAFASSNNPFTIDVNSNFTLQANFQAVQTGNLPAITQIVLINASTNQEIAPISEGYQINLADYPAANQFSFVAKANGLEESVVLNLSGTLSKSQTESVPPYALYGDSGNNFAGQVFSTGSYKIAATPFSGNGGSGTAGNKVEYNFTVIDDNGGTDPDPDPDPDPNATLTIDLSTDGNGNISASPQGPYVPNTTVTITASPNVGFEFDRFNWGFGGLASTDNPYVFTINNSVKLKALFKQGSGGGTNNNPPVVSNPGNQTSIEGQSVNLQIVANDGDNDQNQSLSYNAQNLPTGLSINSNNGLISGTVLGPTSGTSGAFQEQNGLVVIEVESVGLNNTTSTYWQNQTINNEPFYQTKEGQNSFNSVNSNSIITYPVQINTPGIYRVMMKSKVNKGDETTEHNDMWIKLPTSSNVNFFAYRIVGLNANSITENSIQNAINNDNVLYPKGSGKSPNPEGAGGSAFFKGYTNKIGPAYVLKTNDGPGYEIFAKFNQAGTYNLQIAHRSDGFAVDRIALFKVDTYGVNFTNNNLNNLNNQPESSRSGGQNPGASSNSPYNVTVTVTDNGNPAQSASVNFNWTINAASAKPQVAQNDATSVINQDKVNVANIYPNPIGDREVVLELSGKVVGEVQMVIYDDQGREIGIKKLFLEEPQSSIKLNLSDLSIGSGVFFLGVAAEDLEPTTIKLVK